MLKRFMCIAFVVIAAEWTSFAQPTTAPADEKEVVTRVYDISDLLWRKTDYVAPSEPPSPNPMLFGGRASGPGGVDMGGTPPAPKQEMVDQLTKLIEDTVAPQTWKDNGGNLGSMRELSGQLVITQIPEVHQRIGEVLQKLRADRGRMVVVRAYWLLLDPGTAPDVTRHTDGQELPVIDDKLIDAKHLYCQAQTTCFSGQTVNVTSGRERTVVSGLQPIVGSASVGYQPQTESARSGVVLQVSPLLEPEGPDARAILDLQSNVTEFGPEGQYHVPATQPTQGSDFIDRVGGVAQHMQTTVRLPLGKKVLVGGMTLEPTSKEPGGQQLYLVIQADAVK